MWEPESSRSFKSWQTEVCRRGGLPVWTRVLAHRPCDPGRVSGCHPAVPRSGITSHQGSLSLSTFLMLCPGRHCQSVRIFILIEHLSAPGFITCEVRIITVPTSFIFFLRIR